MPTPALEQLASARAFLVAPLGPVTLPLPPELAAFDRWLGDPVAEAVRSGFFAGAAGERLWVPPGGLPLAGLLLLGGPSAEQSWADSFEAAWAAAPESLPGRPTTVAILPPAPFSGKLPAAWSQAGDRFVPLVAARWPFVNRWIWLDWEALA